MTVGDILTLVDALEPNQFTAQQKRSWLSQLDGQVYNELFLTHSGMVDEDEEVSTQYTALTNTLLIPYPYGESIYNHYLQAMMAAELSESARYNAEMQMYNTAYRLYADYVNRFYAPIGASENRIKF